MKPSTRRPKRPNRLKIQLSPGERETRKAAFAELRSRSRAETERLEASYPRRSPRKRDFDYKGIYADLKKYVKAKDLPKLKQPNRAGQRTKKELLKLYRPIKQRLGAGYVYYPIRGNKRRGSFQALFDPKSPGYLKGGFIQGSKSANGKAQLLFNRKGQPVFGFRGKEGGVKLQTEYIGINGEAFLRDPEGYIKGLKLKPDRVYFPAFGNAEANAVGSKGAGINTLPPLWELLENLEFDSNQAISKGRLFALVTTYAT